MNITCYPWFHIQLTSDQTALEDIPFYYDNEISEGNHNLFTYNSV